ncbi:4Fe-4S binding protein [bacterium]|nr:4Fe-4S binding protein [bacterium]
MGVVETIEERCKRCYICVRNCPAKAIKIEEEQIYILDERCIGCGICVTACSQNAIKIESSIQRTYELINSGQNIFVLLGSSFPAAFNEYKPRQIITAIKQLGFEQVLEVAFGAELVSIEYKNLVKNAGMDVIISSTCPAIVNYIEKYHTSLIQFLAPIVSPMTAMGRLIKQQYSPGAKVVYIGPCAAKKKEKDDPVLNGVIDEVLTFKELKDMFRDNNINPHLLDETEFDGPHPNIGRTFPISGGLLKSANMITDILNNDIIVTEGKDRILEIINRVKEEKVEAKFLDLLFCEGCIDGPAMDNDLSVFIRKEIITNYVQVESKKIDGDKFLEDMEKYKTIDMHRTFTSENIELPIPAENEIMEILHKMNMYKKEDEINCGYCGYHTCQEKAIAAFQGLTEIEICTPYLINQLKKANQELITAQERIIRSAKLASMGELAAGVAHEINNPLTGVLTYLKLMKKKMQEDYVSNQEISKFRKYVKTMETEIARCSEIVKNLLEFARPSETKKEPAKIEDIINSSLSLIKHHSMLQNIEIIQEFQPGLPQIYVDAKQIQQVFLSLIINSAQSISNGGKIIIGAKTEDNNNIVAYVTDTGCGIPKENIDKMFDPFFTTKLDTKGTGLGLSVTHSIIERHNGHIEVKSKPEEGTTIIIKFPIDSNKEQ